MQILAASEFREVERDKNREQREIYQEQNRIREIYNRRANQHKLRLKELDKRNSV